MLIPPEWSGWPWRSRIVYVVGFTAIMAGVYFAARQVIYGY